MNDEDNRKAQLKQLGKHVFSLLKSVMNEVISEKKKKK